MDKATTQMCKGWNKKVIVTFNSEKFYNQAHWEKIQEANDTKILICS